MRENRMRLIPVLALTLTLSAPAFGFDRHAPHRAHALPPGVPEGYVLTSHGFLHSSCVYTIAPDEVWSTEERVIRGSDGSVHAQVPACSHPRFDLHGQRLHAAPGKPTPAGTVPDGGYAFPDGGYYVGSGEAYDGWLVAYRNFSSVAAGAKMTGSWNVPALPSNIVAGSQQQDIFIFNGFELDVDNNDLIVQPVLNFGEIPGQFGIESEACCFDGNDVQSPIFPVKPGDTIYGELLPVGCNTTTNVCSSFTIATVDLTSGAKEVLNGNTHGLSINATDPAVVESYGVTSCDMMPASGEIAFQYSLTDASSAPISLDYTLYECVLGGCSGNPGNPSTVPKDCGWAGSLSGGVYTLTFGTSPYFVDGGALLVDSGAGLLDGAASLADLSVAPSDLASGAIEDLSVAPAHHKHGCSMAPLGSPVSSTGGVLLLLFAALCFRKRWGIRRA
jgi:hypothetical protein